MYKKNYATLLSRLLAMLIDISLLIIFFVCIHFFLEAIFFILNKDPIFLQRIFKKFRGIFTLIYFCSQESSESQATIGKKIFNLKVGNEDGTRVGLLKNNNPAFFIFSKSFNIGIRIFYDYFHQKKADLVGSAYKNICIYKCMNISIYDSYKD